jgi:hypothetical protein
MKRMLLVLTTAVAVGAVGTPASANHTARAGDLPPAACNAGTANAHGSLGASAAGHDRIPHQHDGPCVHLVGHAG